MSENIVVFVHGFMGSPKQFEPLMLVAEAAGWEHHCVTLPGHDACLRDFAASGAEDWQAELDTVLTELRKTHKRILLVGHSMGGLLAMNAYAGDPRQLCGILAIALPLYLKVTFDGVRMRIASLLPAKVGEDVRVTAARELCRISGITVFNSIRLLPNSLGLLRIMRGSRKLLKAVPLPVTMINSTADELVAAKTQKFFNSFAPQGKSIELHESSHFWYSQREQKVIETALRELLAAI